MVGNLYTHINEKLLELVTTKVTFNKYRWQRVVSVTLRCGGKFAPAWKWESHFPPPLPFLVTGLTISITTIYIIATLLNYNIKTFLSTLPIAIIAITVIMITMHDESSLMIYISATNIINCLWMAHKITLTMAFVSFKMSFHWVSSVWMLEAQTTLRLAPTKRDSPGISRSALL